MKKKKSGSLDLFWLTYKHRPGSLIVRICGTHICDLYYWRIVLADHIYTCERCCDI